jgi:hypothetical protein
MGLLDLFVREEPVVWFDDEVVDKHGVVWPAYTDDDGVLWIDVDFDVVVVVTGAVVDGYVYEAWVEDDGTLQINLDDD